MTNFERIKQMTISELAEYLRLDYVTDCSNCPCNEANYKVCYKEDVICKEVIEKWLMSKSERAIK